MARRKRMKVSCVTCGKEFEMHPSRLARVQNPACSNRCNGIQRAKTLVLYSGNGKGKKRPGKGLKGAENPAWKGGVTYWRKHGNYPPIKYIRCPDDLLSMARKDNYVMEHRVIVARMAGRPLIRTEVVHHRDRDATNNDPRNLELWPTNQAHKLAEHGRIAIGAACRLSPKV